MKTITNTALMGLVMLVPVAVSAQFLAVLTALSAEPERDQLVPHSTRMARTAARPELLARAA
jgi:hypothetical protein